jgi:hypothetical protein
MIDNKERSLRAIAFSGKQVDWPVWTEKCLARGRRRGYKKVLLGKEKMPSDAETIDPVKDQEKSKLQEQNEDAYEDLIMSIDGDGKAGRVAFQIVKGAKSSDLGDGDAALAWSRLVNKYQPTTTPSGLELIDEFSNCKIKTWKQDPEEWTTTLEDLQTRIVEAGGTKTENDVLEHILINMPKDYNDLYTMYHSKVGNPNNPLTLGTLKSEMTMLLKRLKKQRGVTENANEGEETVLFAGGGFKGRCNGCGKYGHKKADCCSTKKNNFNFDNNGNGNRNAMGRPHNSFGNNGGYAGNRNGQQNKSKQGFQGGSDSQESVTSVERPETSGQIVFKRKTILQMSQSMTTATKKKLLSSASWIPKTKFMISILVSIKIK